MKVTYDQEVEWEIHKEGLYALTKAVYEAWESRDHEEESS